MNFNHPLEHRPPIDSNSYQPSVRQLPFLKKIELQFRNSPTQTLSNFQYRQQFKGQGTVFQLSMHRQYPSDKSQAIINQHSYLHMNPEVSFGETHNKMKRIDELNKSVKQVMKSNQSYRGQLLSAYQNKSRIQIENVVLMKKLQHLEKEKLSVQLQLDESKQKNIILENSNKRFQENNKKMNEKLREEMQKLQYENNVMRNYKYDLDNKTNQNTLLKQMIKKDENLNQDLRIVQKYQSTIIELKKENQVLRSKFRSLQNEKNSIYLSLTTFRQMVEGKDETIRKMNTELGYLQNKLAQAQISKQIGYKQRSDEVALKDRLAHIQNVNFQINRQLIQHKRQNEQLRNKQAQIIKMKTQLITQSSNNEHSVQLSQKDKDIYLLNNQYIRLFSQLNLINQEKNKIQTELHHLKSLAENSTKKISEDFEQKIDQIRNHYQHQISDLSAQIERQRQEHERLINIFSKKQHIIMQKQLIITRHIEQILLLEADLNAKQITIAQQQRQVQRLYTRINQFQHQISNQSTVISNLQIKLSKDNKKHQECISFLTAEMLQIEKKQQAINKIQQQLQNANCKNALLEKQNKTLKQKYQLLKEKIEANQCHTNCENEIKKMQKTNIDLKAQISILQVQLQKVEKALQKERHQNAKIDERVQRPIQLRQKMQKMQRLYEKQSKQCHDLKLKLQISQIKRINTKSTYQSQRAQLSQQLHSLRNGNKRHQITCESMKIIHKQIHELVNLQTSLTFDPKISISRFTTFITPIHRHAFTRQLERVKLYINSVHHHNQQIKITLDILKLNVNIVNKNFDVTFSQK